MEVVLSLLALLLVDTPLYSDAWDWVSVAHSVHADSDGSFL